MISRNKARSWKTSDARAGLEQGGTIGRTIGHYVVRELMGRGGMASVYRAEHRVLGREVALKILHSLYTQEETMVGRFINEARSLASIAHPGIVAIHDIGRTRNGDLYTVMELLEGQTLGERLDEVERLSEGRTLKIARQVACALAAAHGHGVIHRDIKPDNIFLVPDTEVPGGERVKVLDFGIAKMKELGHGDLTAAGIVVGTPAYMAPEQCTPNARIDGRTDIYGLGALMYRMIAGQKPFLSTDEYELLRNHLHEMPAAPSAVGATISPAFEALILRCLAKDPDDRFSTMRELAENLAELEAAAEISGPTSMPYLDRRLPLPAPPMTVPVNVPVRGVAAALRQTGERLRQSRGGTVEIDLSDLDEVRDAIALPGVPGRLLWPAAAGLALGLVALYLTRLLGYL